jgi:hypothetical protein
MAEEEGHDQTVVTENELDIESRIAQRVGLIGLSHQTHYLLMQLER